MGIHLGNGGLFRCGKTIKEIYYRENGMNAARPLEQVYVGNNLVWFKRFPHDAFIAISAVNLTEGGIRMCSGGVRDMSGNDMNGLAYNWVSIVNDTTMGESFHFVNNTQAKYIYWGPYSSSDIDYNQNTPGNPIEYSGLTDVTVHFRMNISNDDENPCYFDSRDINGTMNFYVAKDRNSNKIRVVTVTSNGETTFLSSNDMPKNQVFTLTVSVSKSIGRVIIYFNGNRDSTHTLNSNELTFGNSNITMVGSFRNKPSFRGFIGNIADFRLFKRTLSSVEISYLNQYPRMY